MSRRLPVLGVAALLVSGVGQAACTAPHANQDKTPSSAIAVTVVRPERRTLTRTLKAPGTLEAIEVATLYAKIAGYLSRIEVDRGDRVRRGQVLAEISVPEMASEHDVAAAQLRHAEANLDLQRITADRLTEIRRAEPGAVIQQQVDEALARVQMEEATVSRLRAELARLKTLMGYSTIRAPFDGIVTDRFVDAGAMIQLATTSAQAPIVTVMNMDTVRVFVDVPEPDVPFVTRGTPARLSHDALPGEGFRGTVTRYSTALDPRTRTMKTEIDLPNSDHRLRPGMYGIVTIELERREKALTVPATTLLVDKEATYVFTVVDGRATRTLVTIGYNDGIVVEILDGLEDGARVVESGKGLCGDGSPVVVKKEG